MKLRVRLGDGKQKNRVKFKDAGSVLHVSLVDGHQKNAVKLLDTRSVLPVDMKEIQVVSRTDADPYEGSYYVKPNFDVQTLQTAHKFMAHNVTVDAIEVSKVSNPYGGRTVYIGGIF